MLRAIYRWGTISTGGSCLSSMASTAYIIVPSILCPLFGTFIKFDPLRESPLSFHLLVACLAAFEIATTAGCWSFRSTEIA